MLEKWLQWVQSPEVYKPALEIAIIFGMLYFVLRFLRGTRGEGILKGLATLLLAAMAVLYYVSKKLELARLEYLFNGILSMSLLGLVIIFQPELRRGLVQLGENPFIRLFIKSDVNVLDEIIASVLRLSRNKVGALIAIEREVGLRNYIEGGVKIDAEVRSELIDTIFYPGSALHDGAIIIQDVRIAAAGCLFPLTENPAVSRDLGTRHRAAIGLTEETDAIVIVVSEETAQVSVAVSGALQQGLDKDELVRVLRQHYLHPKQKSASKEEREAVI